MAGVPPLHLLESLLSVAQSQEALDSLVRRLPTGELLVSRINWAGSANAVAGRCVEVLRQHRSVDEELFLELALLLPRHLPELRELAPQLEIHGFDALVPPVIARDRALVDLYALLGEPASEGQLVRDPGESGFRELEARHPEHRARIRGVQACWRAARANPFQPAMHSERVAPPALQVIASTDNPSRWVERDPASLEVPPEERQQHGWIAVVGPAPGAEPAISLRFVEAMAALRAVLLRKSPSLPAATAMDRIRLTQRSESIVMVDKELPKGLLVAIGFLARWMWPHPVLAGLASGEFRASVTPFLHRELLGVGPLRASMLMEQARFLAPEQRPNGVIRVQPEDWELVRHSIVRVAGVNLERASTQGPVSLDPGALGDLSELAELGATLLPPATLEELREMSQNTREILAFGAELSLVEAVTVVEALDTRRVGPLLDALHDVASLHLPALVQVGMSAEAPSPQTDVVQVREHLLIEPTAAGLRIMCAGLDAGRQEAEQEEVALLDGASTSWFVDWIATLMAELELRCVPVRVGFAVGPVFRLTSPHARRAGHPWLFHGELWEHVSRASQGAGVERWAERVLLRPGMTLETLRWLNLESSPVEPQGEGVVRLAHGVLASMAAARERALFETFELPHGRLFSGLNLEPSSLEKASGAVLSGGGARVLSASLHAAIRRTLEVAAREGHGHAIIQAWIFVVILVLWAGRLYPDVVEKQGPEVAVLLGGQLVLVTCTAILVTRVCLTLYERFLVARVLPILHRYQFARHWAEAVERASLRLRFALTRPGFWERLSRLIVEGGILAPLFWWRFLAEPAPIGPVAAGSDAWPALRAPLPKGRLFGGLVHSVGGDVDEATAGTMEQDGRWPQDTRPEAPRALALFSALLTFVVLVIGAQVSAWAWRQIDPGEGDPSQNFFFFSVLFGSLYGSVLYLRLMRIDLGALYLRRIRKRAIQAGAVRHRIYSYLVALTSFVTLIVSSLALEPSLASSIGPNLMDGGAFWVAGLLGLCVLVALVGSDLIGRVVAGAALLCWVAALALGNPEVAAWGALFFSLCLVSMNSVLAFTHYLRLERDILHVVLYPEVPPPRSPESISLFPAQVGLRIGDSHRRLAARALRMVGSVGARQDTLAELRLPVSRRELARSAWFLCDQHGYVVQVGGPGAAALGWLSRPPESGRDLFEGGVTSAARLGLLVRHTSPGQAIEVFVTPQRRAPSPRHPHRLFVRGVIDVGPASTGYLGVAVPSLDSAELEDEEEA